MKRLLLIPLVLFVSCEDNTPNNYTIDASFRYPSEEGSYWEYSCFYSIDTSMMESISIVRIIDNNSIPDSCGDNVITLLSTDSIISNTFGQLLIPADIDPNDTSNYSPEVIEFTLGLDTTYYSHSGAEFSFCERRGGVMFNYSKPPYLQYPLTVGSTWTTDNSLFAFDYEVIGEETILIELKDGTSVNMNCFIITKNIPGSQYYYLSSIGLVKSSYISEPIEVTNFDSEGTVETVTSSSECTLIDYYMAD